MFSDNQGCMKTNVVYIGLLQYLFGTFEVHLLHNPTINETMSQEQHTGLPRIL